MTSFSALFIPPELADAVSDQAWLNAMLDAERALARAEATAGVIPARRRRSDRRSLPRR